MDLIKRSVVLEAIEQAPKFIEDMFGSDDKAIFEDEIIDAINAIPAVEKSAFWDCNDIKLTNCNNGTMALFCDDNIMLAPFFTMLSKEFYDQSARIAELEAQLARYEVVADVLGDDGTGGYVVDYLAKLKAGTKLFALKD